MDQPKPKPRLYVDIDGVLYAHYGGEWQMRPYSVTLLRWAEKHFDIYWLSFNSRRKQIIETMYLPGKVVTDWWDTQLDEKGFKIPVTPDWHPRAIESEKMQGMQITGGIEGEWLFIEDTPPTEAQREILIEKKVLHQWIVVPDTGSDVLLDLKFILQKWVDTRELEVPYEWATRQSAERDLWINAQWKGYGVSGRQTQTEWLKEIFNKEPTPTGPQPG